MAERRIDRYISNFTGRIESMCARSSDDEIREQIRIQQERMGDPLCPPKLREIAEAAVVDLQAVLDRRRFDAR